ncbi:MAG: damage-inducible protein CinA [Gammaproteobacteria bacterium CG11_big_fil_rev_8_21_14_0_20_46_22]|nr:MAG: damage-inducible protein CinA [Gammaproteobacteria bacterium CG12_big_fil_rev_8_21_14_0_65_46_12]PIR12164.1 MAG: damage-inducible protein CinA [Gammaproteobacteria bacterium CG11_big_fil_rev_8_21_14_0_20_46_22]
MKHLILQLKDRLLAENLTLATAESCTGGWVAKLITDIPGSSAWFERGFVTYSNQAKHEMLGVPMRLIEQEGAVSRSVAQAMAQGALLHSRADISVAITGIAGPDGATDHKPVGLVWVAWAKRDGGVQVRRQIFSGDRSEIRQQAVCFALSGLL